MSGPLQRPGCLPGNQHHPGSSAKFPWFLALLVVVPDGVGHPSKPKSKAALPLNKLDIPFSD